MSVLIVGAQGNMGKRYQAIFNYLRVNTFLADIKTPHSHLKRMAENANAILVATPTQTHCRLVKSLVPFQKPILCEKPLSTDISEAIKTLRYIERKKANFSMVLQYAMFDDPDTEGETYYNYFKHGGDGLVWDCFQIIGLARTRVHIYEDSPIWKCQLNGNQLNLQYMDRAYVEFIEQWLKTPGMSTEFIETLHHKTDDYARTHKTQKCLHWNPGTIQ